jgi:AraC-like DNA-binding protein
VNAAPRQRVGGYVEFAPPPAIADCAEAVWLHRTPLSYDEPDTAHRVLPDPSLGLAFTCHRDAEGRPHDARLTVIGPVARFGFFRIVPGYEMSAVRLRLEWTAPLLDLTACDHVNALDDFTRIAPRQADPLLGGLRATRTAGHALRLLIDEIARRRHARAAGPDPLAAAALDQARNTHGSVSIASVARHVDLSERHLRRRVADAAGTSLKRFARARRFLAVLAAMDATPRPSWARLAIEHGFFDQAHLVRDVRHFSGLSPRRLHRERRDEAVFS